MIVPGFSGPLVLVGGSLLDGSFVQVAKRPWGPASFTPVPALTLLCGLNRFALVSQQLLWDPVKLHRLSHNISEYSVGSHDMKYISKKYVRAVINKDDLCERIKSSNALFETK